MTHRRGCVAEEGIPGCVAFGQERLGHLDDIPSSSSMIAACAVVLPNNCSKWQHSVVQPRSTGSKLCNRQGLCEAVTVKLDCEAECNICM